MNARNFGYDVTSVGPSIRTCVRNPTILMRPCLFGGKLHGEMRLRKNNRNAKEQTSKLIFMYSFDMPTEVERREGERERKKTKKGEMIKQRST